MGTTAGGLPYPEPTDPVAQGADAIRSLAEALEGPWVPITSFGAGWADYASAGGWHGVAYCRQGRWVMWRGVVQNTLATSVVGVSTVFTLPAEVRPSKHVTTFTGISTTGQTLRVSFLTTGAFQVHAHSGVPIPAANWISMYPLAYTLGS